MHIPVLAKEIQENTTLQPGDIAVDCTLGLGGHTKLLADQVGSTGKVISLELDADNLKEAKKNLSQNHNIVFYRNNYTELSSILYKEGCIGKVHSVLFDLGVSSPHLDQAERGFSYSKDGKLDMRFDQNSSPSAHDVVNQMDERELGNIFFKFGEEPHSRKIAKKIVQARQSRIIETTTELAEIIALAVSKITLSSALKRVFQALRIYVNHELENIEIGLEAAFESLAPEGRLLVISYHSLEDRIVKVFLKDKLTGCTCPSHVPVCVCHRVIQGKVVTKKPILPSSQEIERNPRARSAKLRILEKL